MFPLNKIKNTELMLLNFDLAFENNISDTFSEPHSACVEYTSADRLNTKEVKNDLSFLHLNIRSLSKNISLLER